MTIEEKKLRIAELDSLITPLHFERSRLKQEVLEESAPFKVGELIAWEGKKGRVVSVRSWLDEASYRVVLIRRDGSDGSLREVHPFHKPVKA